MKAKTSVAAFGLLMMSVVPALLFAKGRTVKITIAGTSLARQIEITDPKIEKFAIYAGPGVFVNGIEEREGFIIDWSKGIVAERPTGLQHYEVSFYEGCSLTEAACHSDEPSLAYLVSYDFDPSTQQGFVYLPDEHDVSVRFLSRMWHGHGFEGHWLYATADWESFVRPLIAKALAAGPSH